MKKRLFSTLTALLMVLGSAAFFPAAAPETITAAAYAAHTRDEAVEWVRSQQGKSIDYDGAYGSQCVDLIQAYYNYLGAPVSGGNGKDYATNSLPSGWSRVQGGQPEPGDIIIFGASSSNAYGHVAIYEDDRIHYHQNFNQNPYVEKITYSYKGLSNPYWGYIRPDWQPPHTHTYTSTVTNQPTCTEAGTRKYTCSSCGHSYTETIAKLGHDYKETVVGLTLTDDGYTLYECSRCHDSYKANIVTAPVLKDDGYYYCEAIPKEVTADKYDIEYKNFFEKTQKDSPGTDWVKNSVVKNEWVNKGGTYTSDRDLPTSDARILVSSLYYHFCGPNAGSRSNYELTGVYVHWDDIAANLVTAEYVGDDEGHPYYYLYKDGARLYCQSGVTCDGSYGTHGKRNCTWYKQNTYQDREKIELYKWTKESDWTNAKESGATRVSIRFKAKHHAVAVEAKEATCTEDGNIAYWYCPDCDKYYSDSACTDEITQESTVIKATGHNYTVTTTEPACTETGENVYTCEKCGDTYNEEIPAKGHNWNAAIYTWSADNKICTAIRVCANDSTHVETESVSTTYSVTKQPTNVEKGTGTYTATFKNTAFAEQTKNVDIPVTTHQYPVVTSEVQGRQFRLKWTAVESAEKYGIAVYQSGGWRVKVQVKSNTTSYTSPKMKSGTYKMVVCAKINGNWDTSSLKSRAFNVKIA